MIAMKLHIFVLFLIALLTSIMALNFYGVTSVLEAGIAVLVFFAVLVLLWLWYREVKRCPRCKEEFSWDCISEIDEPRSTFTERSTGQLSDGSQSRDYEVYEVGLRVSSYACSKCGHSSSRRSSYKKKISGRYG